MSFINYASREINCKIVYYGPGLCGKTANLQYIYGKTNPQARGKMISLATELTAMTRPITKTNRTGSPTTNALTPSIQFSICNNNLHHPDFYTIACLIIEILVYQIMRYSVITDRTCALESGHRTAKTFGHSTGRE